MTVNPKMGAFDRLWTVRDTAEYLQMSMSWVYKMSCEGLLPTRRLGTNLRFSPEEIRAWAMGEWRPMSASVAVMKRPKK